MHHNTHLAVIAVACLLAWSGTATAQNGNGQAAAVRANVSGAPVALADTGSLNGFDDARGASMLAGDLGTTADKLTGRLGGELGSGVTLHAATVGANGDSQSVFSESSVGNFAFDFGSNRIAADFVMAIVSVDENGVTNARTLIDGLTINGSPIAVSGAPNQEVSLSGGYLVINEQVASGSGTVVNAMRIVIRGAGDVTVASAHAGI